MKERELLYAISEAGDNVEMAEKRVQDARSRRETLRRELEEVRERVRVGGEMDKVLKGSFTMLVVNETVVIHHSGFDGHQCISI